VELATRMTHLYHSTINLTVLHKATLAC
jgi:hypothetical protein